MILLLHICIKEAHVALYHISKTAAHSAAPAALGEDGKSLGEKIASSPPSRELLSLMSALRLMNRLVCVAKKEGKSGFLSFIPIPCAEKECEANNNNNPSDATTPLAVLSLSILCA